MTVEMVDKELSTAEAELYDRQIRLWGIESQEKLRAANVLLIGIRGLGSEIAKNILLSGINSLTILDSGTVTEEELVKNFLLKSDTIGQKIAESVLPKAQALNPLVRIIADTEDVSAKNDSYFTAFTIVIGTGLKTETMVKIDTVCRPAKVQFICGDVFGMFGYSLADFNQHEYYEDVVRLPESKKRTHDDKPVANASEKITIKVHRKLEYPAIEDILPDLTKKTVAKPPKRRNAYFYLMRTLIAFRDQLGRDPDYSSKSEDIAKLKEIKAKLLSSYQESPDKLKSDAFDLIFGEVAPISSIVGGVIAQEVIKAVSHKEVPIHNVFLLNPFTYDGKQETVNAVA